MLRLVPPQSRWSLDQDKIQDTLLQFTRNSNIEFHLVSGHADTTTGKASPASGFCLGVTQNYFVKDRIIIYISYEPLISLMRTDLTAAEQKLNVFRFTMTLLHELAVGLILDADIYITYSSLHVRATTDSSGC